MNEKKPTWIVADPVSSQTMEQFTHHRLLLQLLWNRGQRTSEEMDVYLAPDWNRDSHGPELFLQMIPAVNRVFEAFEKGQIITVHGDYDADGVCGSALLVTVLRDLCRLGGFDEQTITFYIPHREKEGYGLSIETVDHLATEQKTSLIITVDCGISNKPAIDRAKTLGIDTIVCDHHTMPQELPDQAILIHPLVPGEIFPNKHLCGTGVAFKLGCALYTEARQRGLAVPEGQEKWLLDLVAIATVTDVMPLTGENRVLETFGLTVLNKTRRVGLRKLVEISGGKFGSLDTTSIGFQIGPRLNAAGRMNHATEALNLLIEEDETKAIEFAQKLHQTNQDRQRLSQQIYLEAKKQAQAQLDSKLIVVVGAWPAGLVGLVSGKLASEFHLPTYTIGKTEELYVGSGRTVGTFDVTRALHAASAHLEKFGGHPQACGFSIRGEEQLEKAIAVLRDFAQTNVDEAELIPKLSIEAEIPLEEIDWKLFEAIESCRPFGQGNPEPLFAARGVSIVSFSTVGSDGKHLKLTVQSPQGKMFPAIAFGLGEEAERLSIGDVVDIAF
ncbi:MAG: single-stranded-DNA-specific exonuclease RecJ, partial [Patescibacteria group bacterium]